MTYAVKITDRVERDLEAIYQAIQVEHSPAANAWYRALKATLLSLDYAEWRKSHHVYSR